MIETVRPPQRPKGGEIDCDGCGARLRYDVEDLKPFNPSPVWMIQQQMSVPGARRVACRRHILVCPHCQTDLVVEF